MVEERINEEPGLLAEISFGVQLQELIGTPGDAQAETIRRNSASIISLLNDLRFFDGKLTAYSAVAVDGYPQPDAVIARYITTKDERVYVFLTTDARPEVVGSVLRALPEKLRKARKKFVFFGYQDPELTASEMNGKKVLESYKETGITLPERYVQVYDLLVYAAKAPAMNLLPKDAVTEYFAGKSPRSNSLMVGNGLNRLNNDVGWTQVLQQLVASNVSPAEQSAADDFVTDWDIPSPVKFEYLANHSTKRLKSSNIFNSLKADIASIMIGGGYGSGSGIKLPPQAIQDLLKSVAIDDLLTTNYDQVLEQCLGLSTRPITESKYILRSTSIKGAVPNIYHVHGIAGKGWNSTICIGYEHYMGYIQKLRARLIRDRRSRETAVQIVFLLLRLVPLSHTWEELFFTTNMSIIGLLLEFEETDLWELLVLRAAVLNTSDTLRSFGLPEEAFTNTITYYDVEVPGDPAKDPRGDDKESKEYRKQAKRIRGLTAPVVDGTYWLPLAKKRAKEKALKGLNVEVRVVHAQDYQKGYEVILGLLPAKPSCCSLMKTQ